MEIDEFIRNVKYLVMCIEGAKRIPDSEHRNAMYAQCSAVKKMIDDYYEELTPQKELF